MIGYVTLGTNDLPRAAAFYDALLGELGAKRLWDSPTGIGWGVAMDKPMLAAMKPHDGQPATHGNGTMVALNAAQMTDSSPWAFARLGRRPSRSLGSSVDPRRPGRGSATSSAAVLTRPGNTRCRRPSIR